MFKVKRLLPLLFSLVLLFCSSVSVQAADGGELYQGTAKMSGQNILIFRQNRDYDYDDEVAYFDNVYFEGEASYNFNLVQKEGHVYDGILYFQTNYALLDVTSNMNFSKPQISLEFTSVPVGIHVSTYVLSSTANSFSISFQVEFNNYIAGYSGNLTIPVVLKVQQVASNTVDNSGYYSNLQYNVTFPTDWTGTLYDYADMTDAPSYEAKTINAIYATNQYISNFKDAVSTHFTDLKSNMQTWYDGMTAILNTQFSDVKAWLQQLNITITDRFTTLFNKMDDEKEEMINGYDPATGDTANNDFNDASDSLNSAEDNLFASASYELDYGQYDSIFQGASILSAIMFVKSSMEAFYSALGEFGIVVTVSLILLVVTRILGYQNLSSGGG